MGNHTAAHIFSISEQTGRTIFSLLMESGIPNYPPEEIEKIAAVLTEKEATAIAQRLDQSSQHYNAKMLDCQKNPTDHIFTPEDYLEMCHEMARWAALWAIQEEVF